MQDTIQGALQPGSQTGPGTHASPHVLTRSHDRMLGGVAGGLADYFDVDPTIVHLGIVLGALVSGGVVLVCYLALWIFMPEAPSGATPGLASAASTSMSRGSNGAMVLGVIMVAIGGFALLDQFTLFHMLGWNLMLIWWPSLLVAVGLALIFARARD
ncbi:MAG: PspC domain-containing protein [Dehalococcoidia bacterium]|nr:PspC domain-containing protein [Dehalococcoidia bacterium]